MLDSRVQNRCKSQQNFKTKRKVSDYAEPLFESPKTLSNVFSIYNQKSPYSVLF